jgi:hypothetical protein
MPANRFLIAVTACLMAAAAQAHHSFAAEFLEDQTDTIEGTVTEVWFKNPHVRYYVEIETDSGTETWDVRGSSPTSLVRKGWTPKTIQEGDLIKVHGHLGRDGRKLMSVISIELADGTFLGQEY